MHVCVYICVCKHGHPLAQANNVCICMCVYVYVYEQGHPPAQEECRHACVCKRVSTCMHLCVCVRVFLYVYAQAFYKSDCMRVCMREVV